MTEKTKSDSECNYELECNTDRLADAMDNGLPSHVGYLLATLDRRVLHQHVIVHARGIDPQNMVLLLTGLLEVALREADLEQVAGETADEALELAARAARAMSRARPPKN